MVAVATVHDSMKATIEWHFALAAELNRLNRELTALTEGPRPTGKKRKPKTPPKPVDREWLKKRKKLLKALRNEKVKN